MINDVMLTGEDGDFGLVRASDARVQAQQLANEEGAAITLRDPTTDEVLDTVEPDVVPSRCARSRAAA